jgi:hypothetical protein
LGSDPERRTVRSAQKGQLERNRRASKGNQYYLVIFLGLTLPLDAEKDDPGWADWTLADAALLAGLYPVLPLTPRPRTG